MVKLAGPDLELVAVPEWVPLVLVAVVLTPRPLLGYKVVSTTGGEVPVAVPPAVSVTTVPLALATEKAMVVSGTGMYE